MSQGYEKNEVVRKKIVPFTLPVDLVETIKELAGKEKIGK